MKQWTQIFSSRIAIIFFGILGMLCLLFVLSPFIPGMIGPKPQLLTFDESAVTSSTTSFSTSSEDRILIPSIGVDMPIISDDTLTEEEAFAKGAWLLPRTARPNSETGNAVIAAHRYMFTDGPFTFYHLDKLTEGDTVTIVWQGVMYTYTVQWSKVVPPTAVEILTPTEEPVLTLFTCTPVFSTKNRLVVVAKLSTSTVD